MPSTEVHIVTYQSAQLIADCLSSIDEHCPPDTTVVVLDNASTDGTADIVAERFPRVRLIRSDSNLLYGPACNRMAEDAQSDRILLLNPDTIVMNDVVTLLNHGLDESDADLAVPTVLLEDGSPQPIVQRFPALRMDVAATFRHTKLRYVAQAVGWRFERTLEQFRDVRPRPHEAFNVVFICSACWLVPTSVARRFPFSDDFPLYDTDVELSRRLADADAQAVVVPEAQITHVGGASSPNAVKRRLVQEARGRYYRQFHGPATALGYRLATGIYDAIRRLKSA